MAIYENGQLTMPIGSEVQVETLPEPEPKIFGESDAAYAARVLAPWGARTRTITVVVDNGSLMGTRQTTAAIPFSATAADIQTQLEGLGVIAPGDIDVQGSGRRFTYAFGGAYLNVDAPRMFSTFANGMVWDFEVIQQGASLAMQAEIKKMHTLDKLGVTDADYVADVKFENYDIGDPRRYNADGSPKRDRR